MMVEPEVGTDVFATVARTGTNASATVTGVGFPFDMMISKPRNNLGNTALFDRMRGALNVLLPNSTDTAISRAGTVTSFDQDGFSTAADAENLVNANNYTYAYQFWKRAKGYMDVVSYNGLGTAKTVPHSLGVVPEMMWVKSRSNSENWMVYTDTTGANDYLSLQNTSGKGTYNTWNGTAPTDSVFSLSNIDEVNGYNKTYVAYLFATLAGISKVGGYTGNGSSQTISCGFSAGSRFILIKRTDASGDWYFWDSVRGIVAGNESRLSLNTTAAQVTYNDSVDPTNSGFIVNQESDTNINVSSGTYIFYAIA
jgi:hypothetical protein